MKFKTFTAAVALCVTAACAPMGSAIPAAQAQYSPQPNQASGYAAGNGCASAVSTLEDRRRYGITGWDGTNNDLYALCPGLRQVEEPTSAYVPAQQPQCVMGGLIGALAGCTPPPPQPPRVPTTTASPSMIMDPITGQPIYCGDAGSGLAVCHTF